MQTAGKRIQCATRINKPILQTHSHPDSRGRPTLAFNQRCLNARFPLPASLSLEVQGGLSFTHKTQGFKPNSKPLASFDHDQSHFLSDGYKGNHRFHFPTLIAPRNGQNHDPGTPPNHQLHAGEKQKKKKKTARPKKKTRKTNIKKKKSRQISTRTWPHRAPGAHGAADPCAEVHGLPHPGAAALSGGLGLWWGGGGWC